MDQDTTLLHRLGTAIHSTLLFVIALSTGSAVAQDASLIRIWNEQTIKAIRNDLARPPIHARNLFHANAAMYDAWAAYDTKAQPWLLGRTVGDYTCAFPALTTPADIEEARKEALSYAVYRLLRHRFLNSPGYAITLGRLNHLMDSLGYDRSFTGVDPTTGGAAALGNYVAQEYIAFGRQDGSNENGNYANQYYAPVNNGLDMLLPGNPFMTDRNRFQPITLPTSIDQSGNAVASTPAFVGAEWGNTVPFSLNADQLSNYTRDGFPWKVYMDPGPPAELDFLTPDGLNSFFKWNHLMVSVWQSHLDPAQQVSWNMSPSVRGNNTVYPTTPAEYADFYDFIGGGDRSTGHSLNPVTGQSYAPNMVDRGNYARGLAEFWADGVDSETPPGHWFEILHDVMDLPQFERRWMGQGPVLGSLEFDVKAHFALGAAMHDAAITAWGIKGYYDTARPVSAIRYMGDLGQCTDPLLPHYHPAGVPLLPGFVEQVMPGDALEGAEQEHLNKIKLYTYRGPSYVTDPATDVAGVGWILCERWWPYQRPTFVTPPFAGYISGHSVFSRTAAEVLASFTGSPFFPGGMIEYVLPQNEFLVFEDGPDEDVRLQWATYMDASDACSLSRIWGGIHPPMDDIPGRKIGMVLGPQVVDLANELFASGPPRVVQATVSQPILGPAQVGVPFILALQFDRPMDPSVTITVSYPQDDPLTSGSMTATEITWTAPDRVELVSSLLAGDHNLANIDVLLTEAKDLAGKAMAPFAMTRAFRIDTHQPVATLATDRPIYNRQDIGASAVNIRVHFDEACDMGTAPLFALTSATDPTMFLAFNASSSEWVNDQEYKAVLDLLDVPVEVPEVNVTVSGSSDLAGNLQVSFEAHGLFAVDTRQPLTTSVSPQSSVLGLDDLGSLAQVITLTFDEAMDQTFDPQIGFVGEDPLGTALVRVSTLSVWEDGSTCHVTFSLANTNEALTDLDVHVLGFRDVAGNELSAATFTDLFSIDTQRPSILSMTPSAAIIADEQVGGNILVQMIFSEAMDLQSLPFVQPTLPFPLAGTLTYSPGSSTWSSNTTFDAAFTVIDANVEVADVGFTVEVARDAAGNSISVGTSSITNLLVDTRNPVLQSLTATPNMVTDADLGPEGLTLTATFDEAMDQDLTPSIVIGSSGLYNGSLIFDAVASAWSTSTVFEAVYGVQASVVDGEGIACQLSEAKDLVGNNMMVADAASVLNVHLTGVGMAEVNALAPPTFLPNPLISGSPLYVRSDHPLGANVMTVLDAQGRTVLSKRIVLHGEGPQPLELSGLSPGVYEILLNGVEYHFASRVIVVAP